MVSSAGSRHIVQFYEKDSFLIAKLTEFLLPGLRQGEMALVIATSEHRKALVEALSQAGWDEKGPGSGGGLVLLDARETLDLFLVEGYPDDMRFRRFFGEILARARGKAVRAFGEMVALLWSEGRDDAALRLEDLWEEAVGRAPISLLCAYQLKAMAGPTRLPSFRAVCARHRKVLPTESYLSADLGEEDRLRAVAELQQRAASLESLREEAIREQVLREEVQRKQEKQAAALVALNRAASTLVAERDLETIVQTATDAGREVCGAAFGAFFYNRVDEQGEAYQLYTLSGAPREAFSHFPMPRNTPIFAPTFEGKGPVRHADVTASARYGTMAPHHGMPKGHLPVRSYLAVPVVSRTGSVLGGLFYGHPSPGVFDEAAERNLVSLAALAAVAIDNADLYEALQKEIAQGRARENAARHFAALVASSSDAIISKDLTSIVTSWNASAERIFGYSAGEMIGQSIVKLIPENLLDEEPEILRRIQAGETISSFETVRRRKDGKLINISLTISPIKDEAGRIIGASKIARDITEMKAAEVQLRQAQKMEAVGRLAGGIAHDFNNLLTSILGFVGMALDEAPPGSGLAEYLDEVRKAGVRASTLTQQLLAYSRKQVLATVVLDLNASVAESGTMLRRLIGEDVHFQTRLDPGLGTIKADPGQILQIIMNLALNARDAMPQGGDLRIETDNVFLDRDYVAAHQDAQAGPHVRLTVSDTGHGMTPDVLAHIFEPFFTTKPVGKGTGLGLSSVYGIVKQSGGSIDVQSVPGKGSTFRIFFPMVDGDGIRREDGAPRLPQEHARRGETILLAEDEASVRKFLVFILRSQGYRVIEAKDGLEALESAKGLDRIDLLLTDVVMPNLGGSKLYESLRKAHPGLKTLFISGYTRDSNAPKEPQDTAFLQKPFTRTDLLAKVREALESGVER